MIAPLCDSGAKHSTRREVILEIAATWRWSGFEDVRRHYLLNLGI